MWRAMRIKGTFTQKDIMRLTGASRPHVKKYVRYLRRQGLVEAVAGQDYVRGLYRLKDPDNAPLEHPKVVGEA